MKWLPCSSHESQKAYFAKSGISWHIIVFERKIRNKNGELMRSLTTHVTVLCGAEKQESTTNLHLMMKSLEVYAKANPDIKSVWIRSDQAG